MSLDVCLRLVMLVPFCFMRVKLNYGIVICVSYQKKKLWHRRLGYSCSSHLKVPYPTLFRNKKVIDFHW